jgi:hypothetical protein
MLNDFKVLRHRSVFLKTIFRIEFLRFCGGFFNVFFAKIRNRIVEKLLEIIHISTNFQ